VAGALTILALEAVDGVATFELVSGLSTFDATGGATFSATIPAGLAGHEFTLRAYAHDAMGRVIASSTQSVSCK